jgi:hypothetical protein
MKKVFFIILISCFSLTIFSCAKEEEKKEGPVLTEVYPVTTPTSDPSPNYTFSSTKAGTITYGGSCSSGTTSATSGNNTITFTSLSDGTYSDCTIIVTDSDGNASNTLAINTFIVADWAQEAYVKASNNDNSDLFGINVALDGDTLAVGAKYESSNQTTITNDNSTVSSNNSNSTSGAVYVYKRNGTTWAQEAYIKASNNEANDWFGNKVALDGDTLAVGVHREDSNQTTITNDNSTASSNNSNNDSGAVYVYKRTGTTWAQEAYIKASNSEANDYFGYSVVLDNDNLAVGAYGEDSNQTTITNDNSTASSNNSNSRSGAVYVYKRTGTTWAQEAYIKASNSEATDWFGYSVALDSDTLAVGAYKESSNQTTITNGTTSSSNNSNNRSGAVYVYKRTGTTWEQEAYIKASNNGGTDEFGLSVALYGDTLAVGAYAEDSNQTTITNNTTSSSDNSSSNSGAVYVYKRTGTTWEQEAYVKASNSEATDKFGEVVTLYGDTLAVGTIYEDSNQTTITNGTTSSDNNGNLNSGAVYVYKRTGTTWAQEAYVKSSNNDASDLFGLVVSLDGDTLAVGAYLEDSNQTTITNDNSTASSNNSSNASGAVYVYSFK